MPFNFAFHSTCLALAFGLASPVLAQSDGPNLGEVPLGASGPVATIDAALTIADLGRAESDPLLLLAAAAAIQHVGSSEGDGRVEAGTLPEDAKPADESTAYDKPASDPNARDLVAELISEARFMARGDDTILDQADAITDRATRGSTTGPGRYRVQVDARDYSVIREEFRGGEIAEVSLVGDGDTDLDLLVFDENGNEICKADGLSDREFCRWTPAWTGTFVIGVANLGRVYNNAVVRVN